VYGLGPDGGSRPVASAYPVPPESFEPTASRLSDLVDQMKGHVPLSLPSRFGLAGAWAEGEGFLGAATWTDAACRELSIALSSSRALPPGGPRVGPWTVTVDAPRACGNASWATRAVSGISRTPKTER
jgi:hypothetical protein